LDESSLIAAECFRKLALSARYDAVMESLGLTCADQFLHSHLTSLIKRLSDEIMVKQRYQEFGFIASDKMDAMEGILTEDDLLRDSVTKIEIMLKEHANYNPLYSQLTCSPKLISLIDTLHKQWEISGGSFQCIIFVSQRHVVTSLCWILANHPDCTGWLRPATLMGHGDDETSGFARGMTIKEQNAVRQDFKAKVYNTRQFSLHVL
jgi:endoribonuclease Dicer